MATLKSGWLRKEGNRFFNFSHGVICFSLLYAKLIFTNKTLKSNIEKKQKRTLSLTEGSFSLVSLFKIDWRTTNRTPVLNQFKNRV